MKRIETNGITYIEAVPGCRGEWYYGLDYPHGDLYEAEELFRAGKPVEGRDLILIRYPDGAVFRPVEKTTGEYCESPVYSDGGIYILNVSFKDSEIRVLRFDCADLTTGNVAVLPLDAVKDCYNLQLHVSPVTLTRQGAEGRFDIVWPERCSFDMGEHESFFLRDGDRLFFNKWYEEGEGADYRYWEETVVRSLDGKVLDVLPGDLRLMPDGEIWHLG
ncbi:MAG: hypothetical protein K6A91_06150 [Clostridia bacterium]|nr:hypothetical protein [Clostridia bacterium]